MRRYALLGLALILLLVAGAALAWRIWFAPATLTVAVGPAGSEDTRLIAAVASTLARDRESVRFKIVPTEDEAASARAVDDGSTDLAVVRSDVATLEHAQTLAILHRDAALVVATAASGITTPADLRGRTVGIVRSAPANLRLLHALLAHYEIPDADVRTVVMADASGAEAALRAGGGADRAGGVDAILVVGTLTGRSIRDVVSAAARASGGATPVLVPIADADAIAQESGIYESFEVVRGAFGGSPPRPAEPIRTLGVSHRLAVANGVENATVAELTRLIFAMRPGLAATVPLANRIEAPDTAKGSAVPVHPGAISYYDNEVETFFDRYDDFIYLSVMAFSILGSGFAGLLSTASAKRRARTLGLLDRLLGIVRLARVAESGAELDALRLETDDILAHALGNAGRGGLDDAGISAFSLGLEQARYAIAERRALLGGAPAPVAAREAARAAAE